MPPHSPFHRVAAPPAAADDATTGALPNYPALSPPASGVASAYHHQIDGWTQGTPPTTVATSAMPAAAGGNEHVETPPLPLSPLAFGAEPHPRFSPLSSPSPTPPPPARLPVARRRHRQSCCFADMVWKAAGLRRLARRWSSQLVGVTGDCAQGAPHMPPPPPPPPDSSLNWSAASGRVPSERLPAVPTPPPATAGEPTPYRNGFTSNLSPQESPRRPPIISCCRGP